jgi:hypothetical protein
VSRGQRIGLVVAVAVVAIVAFVIAKPGSNDNNDKTTTQASGPSKPSKPAGPETFRITLKGHNPVGGKKTIVLTKGERALIVVNSDGKDTIHLHGWDIERDVSPSTPGRFAFTANNEGAYEMESHTTEQKIATIQVRPG